MQNFSVQDLLDFLTYAEAKGLGNKSTLSSRRTTVAKVLGILDDHEKSDVRSIDLESAFSRFVNLEGTNYRPDSLQVYKSRLQSSVEDFLRYRANPAGFRMGRNSSPRSTEPKKASSTAKTGGGSRRDTIQVGTKDRDLTRGPSSEPRHLPHLPAFDVPVPIRPGVVVTLTGVPLDLTEGEARRITKIVEALAQPAPHD